jgi:hypothetical protein
MMITQYLLIKKMWRVWLTRLGTGPYRYVPRLARPCAIGIGPRAGGRKMPEYANKLVTAFDHIPPHMTKLNLGSPADNELKRCSEVLVAATKHRMVSNPVHFSPFHAEKRDGYNYWQVLRLGIQVAG